MTVCRSTWSWPPCTVCALRPCAVALARSIWLRAVSASDVVSMCAPREVPFSGAGQDEAPIRDMTGITPGSADPRHRSAGRPVLASDAARAAAGGGIASSNEGIRREDRRDRWDGADRVEAGGQAGRARARGGARRPEHRREHPHRRGSGRGARGRGGRGGRVELAVVRRRRGDGVLPDLHHQPARVLGEGGGRALRGAVGGRHGPAVGVGLLPREDRPGEADPRVGPAVLDRARHPVLRVRQGHRGLQHGRRQGPPAAGPDPADGVRRRRRRRSDASRWGSR